MPALFTRASIDPNLLIAVSTTLAATALSPILPSTSASSADSVNAPDFVMLRELATTTAIEERLHHTRSNALRCTRYDDCFLFSTHISLLSAVLAFHRRTPQEIHCCVIGDVVRRQKMKTEIETLEILQPGESLQRIIGIELAIGNRCPHRTRKIEFPQCGEPSDFLQFLWGSQRTNKIQTLDLEIAYWQQ